MLLMTSGCLGCREVWAALAEREASVLLGTPEIVVVTPDPTLEDSRKVADLAPPGVTVVMSTETWQAFRAGPAPWVAVVRDGRIVCEGAVAGWSEVVSLVDGCT